MGKDTDPLTSAISKARKKHQGGRVLKSALGKARKIRQRKKQQKVPLTRRPAGPDSPMTPQAPAPLTATGQERSEADLMGEEDEPSTVDATTGATPSAEQPEAEQTQGEEDTGVGPAGKLPPEEAYTGFGEALSTLHSLYNSAAESVGSAYGQPLGESRRNKNLINRAFSETDEQRMRLAPVPDQPDEGKQAPPKPVKKQMDNFESYVMRKYSQGEGLPADIAASPTLIDATRAVLRWPDQVNDRTVASAKAVAEKMRSKMVLSPTGTPSQGAEEMASYFQKAHDQGKLGKLNVAEEGATQGQKWMIESAASNPQLLSDEAAERAQEMQDGLQRWQVEQKYDDVNLVKLTAANRYLKGKDTPEAYDNQELAEYARENWHLLDPGARKQEIMRRNSAELGTTLLSPQEGGPKIPLEDVETYGGTTSFEGEALGPRAAQARSQLASLRQGSVSQSQQQRAAAHIVSKAFPFNSEYAIPGYEDWERDVKKDNPATQTFGHSAAGFALSLPLEAYATGAIMRGIGAAGGAIWRSLPSTRFGAKGVHYLQKGARRFRDFVKAHGKFTSRWGRKVAAAARRSGHYWGARGASFADDAVALSRKTGTAPIKMGRTFGDDVSRWGRRMQRVFRKWRQGSLTMRQYAKAWGRYAGELEGGAAIMENTARFLPILGAGAKRTAASAAKWGGTGFVRSAIEGAALGESPDKIMDRAIESSKWWAGIGAALGAGGFAYRAFRASRLKASLSEKFAAARQGTMKNMNQTRRAMNKAMSRGNTAQARALRESLRKLRMRYKRLHSLDSVLRAKIDQKLMNLRAIRTSPTKPGGGKVSVKEAAQRLGHQVGYETPQAAAAKATRASRPAIEQMLQGSKVADELSRLSAMGKMMQGMQLADDMKVAGTDATASNIAQDALKMLTQMESNVGATTQSAAVASLKNMVTELGLTVPRGETHISQVPGVHEGVQANNEYAKDETPETNPPISPTVRAKAEDLGIDSRALDEMNGDGSGKNGALTAEDLEVQQEQSGPPIAPSVRQKASELGISDGDLAALNADEAGSGKNNSLTAKDLEDFVEQEQPEGEAADTTEGATERQISTSEQAAREVVPLEPEEMDVDEAGRPAEETGLRMVASETTEEIIERTEPGDEREQAFERRAGAAKKLLRSAEPGDKLRLPEEDQEALGMEEVLISSVTAPDHDDSVAIVAVDPENPDDVVFREGDHSLLTPSTARTEDGRRVEEPGADLLRVESSPIGEQPAVEAERESTTSEDVREAAETEQASESKSEEPTKPEQLGVMETLQERIGSEATKAEAELEAEGEEPSEATQDLREQYERRAQESNENISAEGIARREARMVAAQQYARDLATTQGSDVLNWVDDLEREGVHPRVFHVFQESLRTFGKKEQLEEEGADSEAAQRRKEAKEQVATAATQQAEQLEDQLKREKRHQRKITAKRERLLSKRRQWEVEEQDRQELKKNLRQGGRISEAQVVNEPEPHWYSAQEILGRTAGRDNFSLRTVMQAAEDVAPREVYYDQSYDAVGKLVWLHEGKRLRYSTPNSLARALAASTDPDSDVKPENLAVSSVSAEEVREEAEAEEEAEVQPYEADEISQEAHGQTPTRQKVEEGGDVSTEQKRKAAEAATKLRDNVQGKLPVEVQGQTRPGKVVVTMPEGEAAQDEIAATLRTMYPSITWEQEGQELVGTPDEWERPKEDVEPGDPESNVGGSDGIQALHSGPGLGNERHDPEAAKALDPDNMTGKAKKFQKMLNEQERVSIAEDLRPMAWYEVLQQEFLDSSGVVKWQLRSNGGVAGEQAAARHELVKGAVGAAQAFFREAVDRVYGDITSVEMRRALAYVLQAARTMELDEISRLKDEDIEHPQEMGQEFARDYMREAFENLGQERTDRLLEAAKAYWQVQREQIQRLHDAGLISDDAYETLTEKHKHYNPRQFIQHIDPQVTEEGAEKVQSEPASGLQPLQEGSNKLMKNDPKFFLAQAILRTERRVKKNRAAKELLRTARNVGDKEDWIKEIEPERYENGQPVWPDTQAGWSHVKVKEDGQERRVAMPSKFVDEWTQYKPEFRRDVSKWMGRLSGTTVLKATATGANPGFALSNPFRDIPLLWLDADSPYSAFLPLAGAQIVYDLASVLKDTVFRTGRYQDYVKQGGAMNYLSGVMPQNPETANWAGEGKKAQEHIAEDVEGGFTAGLKKATAEAASHVGRVASFAGETSEVLTRLAMRERAIKNGVPEWKATHIARRYLDFEVGGNFAKGYVDPLSPYLNAGIQATRTVGRSMRKNWPRLLFGVAQLSALGAGLSANNILTNEDSYKNIRDGMKNRYWIITMPDFLSKHLESVTPDWFYKAKRKTPKGEPVWDYFTIPKPPGLRFPVNMVEIATEAVITGETDWGRAWDSVWRLGEVIPVSSMPPVIQGLNGYYANYNWFFGNRIYQGETWQGNPSSEYSADTSPAWRKVGELLNLKPDRLRYGVSQVVPPYNPFVQLAGSTIDAAFDSREELPGDVRRKFVRELWRGITSSRRIVRTTAPYDPEFLNRLGRIGGEHASRQHERNVRIAEMFRRDASKKEVASWIKSLEDVPPAERKRLWKRFATLHKEENIPSTWLHIANTSDPEARADKAIELERRLREKIEEGHAPQSRWKQYRRVEKALFRSKRYSRWRFWRWLQKQRKKQNTK